MPTYLGFDRNVQYDTQSNVKKTYMGHLQVTNLNKFLVRKKERNSIYIRLIPKNSSSACTGIF